MRIAPVAFALAALLAASAASANDISYNHLDVGYAKVDIDDFSEDADGILLRASFEFAGNFFVFGSYSDLSVDVDIFDIDLTDYEIGLGYAWPVGNASSLYGKVSYVSAEADALGVTVDDDGYGMAVGLRTRPAAQLELETYLDYVDLDDSGDDTSVGLAGRYFLTPLFALALEAQFGDDATTYGLGFRWHWGN